MPKKPKRNPWESFFDTIRVYRAPHLLHVNPNTEAELDTVEEQLGTQLPESYRDFMKRFGPGEFQNWVRLTAVTPKKKGDSNTLVEETTRVQNYWRKHPDWRTNHKWLLSLVYFGSSVGGDSYAWDPAAVTTSRPHEYKVYYLARMGEQHPVEAGNSFWEFLQWAVADIRSWREPEDPDVDDEVGFSPRSLRAKKKPLKRDVQQWLKWDGGTVGDLARSIREDDRRDVFPILADALQDAGCTHKDLLNSCRSGFPDVDGRWVLEILLGKPSAK